MCLVDYKGLFWRGLWGVVGWVMDWLNGVKRVIIRGLKRCG